MDELARFSFAALSAIKGIGYSAIFRISEAQRKHKLGWSEFWVYSRSKLALLGLNEKQIDGVFSFRKEHTIYTYQEFLQIREIRVVLQSDNEYPYLLRLLPQPPYVLFTKGRTMQWFQQPVIAIVGTRHNTAYGEAVTQKITRELTAVGATIVSGCMYGVDALAHQTALDMRGTTVGVLGFGFDHCYPASFRPVLAKWLEQGMTIVTPFAPDVSPKKGNFPARNQIVAGMCHATVVTEAGEKSGSHITAQSAADEGRIVCAVPGPITNPYSLGTKALINEGAILVTAGSEVLSEVTAAFNVQQVVSPESEKVLSQLQSGPISTNQLSHQLLLPVHQLQIALSELELSGSIVFEAGKWRIIGN